MAESQSRYGIMEELNNRKINEKEKLANIERETDNKVYETEKGVNKISQEIAEVGKTYEQNHKDKVREMELNLSFLENDYKRKKETITGELKEEKEGYKKRFQDWKRTKEAEVKLTENDLNRYKDVQGKKIEEKEAVITEIDNGIKSLKEISKDQKSEE